LVAACGGVTASPFTLTRTPDSEQPQPTRSGSRDATRKSFSSAGHRSIWISAFGALPLIPQPQNLHTRRFSRKL